MTTDADYANTTSITATVAQWLLALQEVANLWKKNFLSYNN